MTIAVDRPLRHDPGAGHPLIDGPDGLTPEWLTAVLRAQGLVREAQVLGLQQEPIGNGLLGFNLRLSLEYDRPEAGAPASLVAKMASPRAESRESCAALNLYGRETRFYQELAPRIREGLAATLFADVSADGASFCLLFEDLSPARMGDQLAGCDLDDARTAMATAAALHAPLWGDADLPRLDWINRNAMVKLYIETLPAYVPAAAERFAKWLEPGAMDIAAEFGQRIGRYFELHDTPWTISHQDFRLDNLLFDACNGGVKLAVVDWQTFVPGPGALDAAYFNGAGLPASLRRDNEEQLARLYYSELQKRGVTDYPWERCWRDYRLHASHGLIMAIVGAAISSPTERGDEMLSALINRHAKQMIDLDSLALIQ
ncbi:MAG: ecdysteroid 22-kinase family protein [Salinisphaera sp.]|nr:ecdysteroid 22-kinase family protein [Nevskiaceae bacterium]MDN5938797.1 ecdysteroid 22-kinase family protein [Salinisphaera sp.]